MAALINEDLQQLIADAERSGLPTELPIIVKLAEGTDVASLAAMGMTVHRVIDSISVVSGTLAAAAIKQLAQHPGVLAVEYDNEAHAMH